MRKVALDLVRLTEKSGSSAPPLPGHRKWQKSCINICKHILKFSNCVLARVPINNNNYEHLIVVVVIILAKKLLHKSPWSNLMLAPTPANATCIINVYVNIQMNRRYSQQGWGLEDTICSCWLCIKSEVYWSTIVGPGEATYFIYSYLALNWSPTLFIKQITVIGRQAGCWPDVITI